MNADHVALTRRAQLFEAIGAYGVEVTTTGILAPTRALLDAVDAAIPMPPVEVAPAVVLDLAEPPRMPDRQAVRMVRQVLANELGIDRDGVRMIITERIDRLLSLKHGTSLSKLVEQAVDRAIDAQMKERRYDRTDLRTVVADAAAKAITNRMMVSVTLKDAA